MKPKMLVLELWGMGDVGFATPFLQAASREYEVTLLAKPVAGELAPLFCPSVKVLPFIFPWTAPSGKYRLHRWPWKALWRLIRSLRRERFQVAVSGRWDPRDHFLMFVAGAKRRMGFPRTGSRLLLSESLVYPPAPGHRYDFWHDLGRRLNLQMPPLSDLPVDAARSSGRVVFHSGASTDLRVWPLERFAAQVARLRKQGFSVSVVCDRRQESWWRQQGEKEVLVSESISSLVGLYKEAVAFVGNDSGPGHLAALCGVPTVTIFGPQLGVGFRPIHPAARWVEGKACPYKPCFDNCRYAVPHCLRDVTEAEVGREIDALIGNGKPSAATGSPLN